MSGTFPDTIAPVSVDITSHQPTLVRVAESGKRQARNAGGHLWEISIDLPVMRRFEFEPINAFIMAQGGSAGSFQYVPPNKATPLGVATGTPVISVPAAIGATFVFSTGWTASQTGILKAGDLIKFPSHDKVYMATQDADSNPAGDSLIYIQPPLIVAEAASGAISHTDVPFTVYVGDVHKYRTTAPNFSSYKVKLMESL